MTPRETSGPGMRYVGTMIFIGLATGALIRLAYAMTSIAESLAIIAAKWK